jgi:hypothetical protein
MVFFLKKIISLETLADLSALSVRQIQRLVKNRVISLARDKKGNPIRARVVLGEAVPKLFEHSRNTHAVGDPAIARFRRARAQREEADAAMAKIELGYQRGKYLLASAVEEDGIRMLTACRAPTRRPSRRSDDHGDLLRRWQKIVYSCLSADVPVLATQQISNARLRSATAQRSSRR